MGWTWQNADYYKNGKIDRKAECDAYWTEGLNKGHFNVLKSAMVGSTYYAAVQALKKRVGHDDNGDIYEDIPESERKAFGIVFLTSTDTKDYFNFGYKDMDESELPYNYDCPKSILDLLSPTDCENALEWRRYCREKLEQKKLPTLLNKLPVSTKIEWTLPCDLMSGAKKGDKKILHKSAGWGKKRPYWTDGWYRYSTKLIGDNYTVIKEEA